MKILAKYLAVATIVIWTAIFVLPDDKLHVVFCDVGQGDAILVRYKAVQILIDTGPDNKVVRCLTRNLPFYDRRIETVVLTHPESDHVGGLISVSESYRMVQIVIAEKENLKWDQVKQIANENQAKILEVESSDRIKSGRIEFRIGELGTGDVNDKSLAGELVFGKFKMLLSGDAEARVLGWSSQNEIIKVPHHGSRDAVTEELLDKVKPKLAVISVGKNNFGHPTEEVLELLENAGVKVLRTDDGGEIEVVSDGLKWWVR